MKLEGSLDAFSLQDIFQLLSFTRKTGGLHLRSGRSDGVVWFVGGAISGASADSTRQALARRLIGAGAVGDEALAAAVQRSAEGESIGVTRALVEAGAGDRDLVAGAAREQVVDAVFDLLRWTEGDFAFAVDQRDPDDVDVVVPVEEAVTEASSRRDAWAAVVSVIPSPETVLRVPVSVADEGPSLSREEWGLLALVDGRRTVAELVDLAGRSAFLVVSALAHLVERGLLVVPDGEDHVQATLRRHALLGPLEGDTFQPKVVLREGNNSAAAAHDQRVAASGHRDGSPVPAPAPPAAVDADAAVEPPGSQTGPGSGADEQHADRNTDRTASDDGAQPVEHTQHGDQGEHQGGPELGGSQQGETQPGETQHGDTQHGDAQHGDTQQRDSQQRDSQHGEHVVEPGAHQGDSADAPSADASAPADDTGSDDSSDGVVWDDDAPDATDDGLLGGAHVPQNVVPPRPEPFLPKRQAEFDEGVERPVRLPAQTGPEGAAAGSPGAATLIERDPSINRSLMLRLIAGVRGL